MEENISTPPVSETSRIASGDLPEQIKEQIEEEKKILNNVMNIRLSSDGVVIQDGDDAAHARRIPGVYCQGIQYYDLKDVQYINNTGMAILIDLLKSLLELGVEVQFVNVDERIKKKVRDLGLEQIINWGDKNKA